MRRFGILPWTLRDDIHALSDFFDFPEGSSWTLRGQWVDTDRYDIVPRPEYRKSLIEKKEQEIKDLKERQETAQKELSELKQKL